MMIEKDFFMLWLETMLSREGLIEVRQDNFIAQYYRDSTNGQKYHNIDIFKDEKHLCHYTISQEMKEEELKKFLNDFINKNKPDVEIISFSGI